MNENQAKFLELAKKYEKLKSELGEVKESLEAIMKNIGVDHHFQDPDTAAVFKIVIPTGRFVSFDTISYIRTALEGETRGSFAKKEAESLGYYLKKANNDT